MNPRILHVFNEKYILPKHLYLGSVKDIRGRTEYFQKRDISYTELLSKAKDRYYETITGLSNAELRKYSAVILEMTYSPSAIRFIKKVSPHTTVIVRSHNAEFLHRWDYVRADGLSSGTFKLLRQAFKNSIYDYLSGKRTDYIISISQWEQDHYWARIINGAKCRSVPFFLPGYYESEISGGAEKKLQCINFTSSSSNPVITDSVKNFIKVVTNLNNKLRDWKFCITGDNSKYNFHTPERIQWTGLLNNPYHILSESRAMALLSDFGYGFKTKIIEAILAKTYVLMTEGLYQRMPKEVLPYCIPIDINMPGSFEDALYQCMLPYPEGNPNDEFRNQAFSALDEILLR